MPLHMQLDLMLGRSDTQGTNQDQPLIALQTRAQRERLPARGVCPR